MATSGRIEGNTLSGEGSYTDWQLAGQDVGGNFSVINWQTGWRYPAFTCRGLRLGSTNINGTNVWTNSAGGDGVHQYNSGHNHTPQLQLASGQIVIPHNADGTKSFGMDVSIRGWEGGGPNFLSNGSGSFALPTIPRFSSPPSTPVISSITSTSFFVTFTDGSGGAPIDGREIRYSTNSDGSSGVIVSSDGSTSITGLTPGATYYVWARTHNSAGYSDWSARAQATTLNVPAAPAAPTFSNKTQVGIRVSWTAPSNGGSTITGYQVSYGDDSGAADTVVSDSASPLDITGLLPGKTYWFKVRAINAIGNGAYSPTANTQMIAGAFVKDGGVYKKAVPYVKDAGVWKLARPWGKTLGVWKESI